MDRMKTKRLIDIGITVVFVCLITILAYNIPVSAAGITGTIDYIDEIITVSGLDDGGEDGGNVLFYAVGKDIEKASGSKAKWYPLIGETIDISKTIPKKADAKVYVGLKSPDGTVNTVEIVGRPDAKPLKTEAKTLYNGTNAFVNESDSYDIEFKIGLSCEWISIAKNDKSDEIYYPDMFPIGAAGVVRIAAGENSFASAEVKFKIGSMPKSPNGDKIGFGQKKDVTYVKGLTDKMEVCRKADFSISEVFSVTEADYDDFWLNISEKNMKIVDFVKAVTGDSSIDGDNYTEALSDFLKDDHYVFSLRFKSTDKKSASAITAFKISKVDMAAAFSVEPDNTISLINIKSLVKIGDDCSVTVKGLPETEYSIKVHYPSGESVAEGVTGKNERKPSDKDGVVSWTWKVGTNTTLDVHRLTISGGGSSIDVEFEVVNDYDY